MMTHIDVMKQALEALNTLPCGDSYKTHNAQVQLRKAIDKAEEVEPVAYVSGYYDGHCVIEPIDRSTVFSIGTSFCYSQPPQREWVGLTEQERLKCFGLVSYFDTNCICAEFSEEEIKAASGAIEAKLKEKNT